MSDAQFPGMDFQRLGYDSVHHGEGRWNGVAILSRVGIDEVVGNVKDASIAELYRRLAARHEELRRCQDCWTACRGFNQSLGKGGTARGLATLATRMRA